MQSVAFRPVMANVTPECTVTLGDIEQLLRRELAPLKDDLRRLSLEISELRHAIGRAEGAGHEKWTSLPDESHDNAAPVAAAPNCGPGKVEASLTPGKVEASLGPLLTPGKVVRVNRGKDSRKAMIMCVNDSGVEVEIEEDGNIEELVVAACDVHPLEPFESRPIETTRLLLESGAEQVKNEANELFKANDFPAAIHHYTIAIDYLKAKHSKNIVLSSNGALMAQTVTWNGDTAHTKNGLRVERAQVVNVHVVDVQSTLYVNRARAFSCLRKEQLAAQDLSLAIALWDHDTSHPARSEKVMKAFYLRAKTRLARQKYEPARQDVASCVALEGSSPMLQQLTQQIDRDQRDIQRSNRMLAKEISKWADEAFTNMQ